MFFRVIPSCSIQVPPISHRIHGAGIYTNIKGVFLDGIHGAPYIAAPAGSVMGLVDQTQNISVFSGAAVSYMGCTAQFFFSETKRGQMDRLFLYSESWWKLMADGGFFSYFFKAFGVIIHIYHIYIYHIYHIYISSTVGWSLLGWIFTHYQSLILSFWDFLRNWRETRWQRPRLDAFVTCCPGKPLESRCDMSHARRMQRPWELWGKSLRKWRRRPETKKHEESS